MTGLGALFIATLAFVGGHFLLSSPPVRGPLVARLGEGAFAAVYSFLMLAAFAWMLIEFGSAPVFPLWDAAGWAKSLAGIVMPLSTLLFIGSVTQRNPTMGPGGFAPEGIDAAPGMLKITRHPMLWSFGLWAAVHLPANGHAAALILFGGIGILALGGTLAIDHKRRLRDPQGFARFRAATSNIPFAAMLSGRARLAYSDIGWWRLALAVALYIGLIFAHPVIAGRALL